MRLRDLFRGPPSHERKTISVSSSISSHVPPFDAISSISISQDKDTDTLHKYLLPDQSDYSAKSPQLHVAVESSNVRMIQNILQAGAHVNLTDSTLSTPLHIAAQIGNEEIVQMLLSHGADMYKQDGTGRNPFHIAIANGNIRVIQQFIVANDTRQNIIHTPDAQHWTPLMCACANNHPMVCALLLSHNADLCAVNDRGMTVFHIAAFLGSLPILHELLSSSCNDESLAKAINRGDNRNQTPLFYACMEGHLDIALTLLHAGANAYHLDNDQQTCLHAMLSSSIILKRHIRLFYNLIQFVNFRSYQDYLGRTLLDLAYVSQLKTILHLLILLNYKSNSKTRIQGESAENDIYHSNKQILSLRHICILNFKRSIFHYRHAQQMTEHDVLKIALQQTFQIEARKDSFSTEDNKSTNGLIVKLSDETMSSSQSLSLLTTPQQSNKSQKQTKSTKTPDKKIRKTSSIFSTTTSSSANKWSSQSDAQPIQSTWSAWANKIKGQRLTPVISNIQQISTGAEETNSLQLLLSTSSLRNIAFEILNNPSEIDRLLDFVSLKNDDLLDGDLMMSMTKYHLLLGPN